MDQFFKILINIFQKCYKGMVIFTCEIILTEKNDWEMMVSKNNDIEPVINGQPLLIWRNNGPNSNGCLWDFTNRVIMNT